MKKSKKKNTKNKKGREWIVHGKNITDHNNKSLLNYKDIDSKYIDPVIKAIQDFQFNVLENECGKKSYSDIRVVQSGSAGSGNIFLCNKDNKMLFIKLLHPQEVIYLQSGSKNTPVEKELSSLHNQIKVSKHDSFATVIKVISYSSYINKEYLKDIPSNKKIINTKIEAPVVFIIQTANNIVWNKESYIKEDRTVLDFRTNFKLIKSFIESMAQTLQYLKSINVIHNDLKPDNITLHESRNKLSVKVIDLGGLSIDKRGNIGSPLYLDEFYYSRSRCGSPYSKDMFSLGMTVIVILGFKKTASKWAKKSINKDDLINYIYSKLQFTKEENRFLIKLINNMISESRPTPKQILNYVNPPPKIKYEEPLIEKPILNSTRMIEKYSYIKITP